MQALVLASWSEPSPWIAIGVAALALVAAIVYPARANRIAAQALAISEREEKAREAERKARARLALSIAIVGYEPDVGGVIRIEGRGGQSRTLQLSMSIRNDGDRDAGRTTVEAVFPLVIDERLTRWSDKSGRRIDPLEPAARIGETTVLTRTLDALRRDIPESLFANFSVAIPDSDRVYDHPIRVRVVAESAEPPEVVEDFPLRIGRDPSG